MGGAKEEDRPGGPSLWRWVDEKPCFRKDIRPHDGKRRGDMDNGRKEDLGGR